MNFKIADINIDVVKKDIKHMHLAVYPPDGRVRLSAPKTTKEEKLRLYTISKLKWIKKQQKKFREQKREKPRQFINGESHYFLGNRYLLKVIEHDKRRSKVVKVNRTYIELHVPKGSTLEKRKRVIEEWYRKHLKEVAVPMLEKWSEKVGVEVNDWGVRKMKTKWGSCNTDQHRIWLNLELAKKPKKCVEYIVLHELIHLIERKHSNRFVMLLDQYMPAWRTRKEILGRTIY